MSKLTLPHIIYLTVLHLSIVRCVRLPTASPRRLALPLVRLPVRALALTPTVIDCPAPRAPQQRTLPLAAKHATLRTHGRRIRRLRSTTRHALRLCCARALACALVLFNAGGERRQRGFARAEAGAASVGDIEQHCVGDLHVPVRVLARYFGDHIYAEHQLQGLVASKILCTHAHI